MSNVTEVSYNGRRYQLTPAQALTILTGQLVSDLPPDPAVVQALAADWQSAHDALLSRIANLNRIFAEETSRPVMNVPRLLGLIDQQAEISATLAAVRQAWGVTE